MENGAGRGIMLRMYRNPGQEITIKRKGINDKDKYLRVKVCDIDLHTGRVEIGVSATDVWDIYRAESPRGNRDENLK